MRAEHLLTEERRARMAAERLLAQKERELYEANRRLSRHALALSEDLVETRGKVETAEVEKSQFLADLERANSEIDIAKRRLWNSIQSIEDGFAVFDADSRMIIANAAYLAPFDGLECVRPGAHYQEIIEAALYEGMVDIEGKSPTQWRDDMLARWFSVTPEPRVIRLWDGTWIRLVDHRAPGGDTVSLGLNITDTMRREAALETARERAEAASRAKSAFLANMSHEIRTPMNGVVGMADLLADSGLDEEQMIYVDTIRSSGQALLSIINDVLDYSKIEANKLTLHAEPFDLERTILDVLQLLEPSIREKKLKVMLDYDMFLPTRYIGDPVRMRQILTNLMGNAVKFTHNGHILVRVVGLPDGPARHRIHLTVEDTGIGIPADKLKLIFGEFNQVDDERNRAYEGTGLGLAITKQLVELMQGEVWVESEQGVGSVFGIQVTLPVADEVDAPEIPDWVKRALLVMDDDLSRDILEKRLIALGLRVDRTARAASVDALRASEADVIFADQRMSDMGVASFIAVLRAGGVVAPVVLVAPTTARTVKVAGAAATLTKPIARPALIDVLTTLAKGEPMNVAPAVEDSVAEDAVIEGTAIEVPAAEAPAMETEALETPAMETPTLETEALEAPVVEAPMIDMQPEAPVVAEVAELPAAPALDLPEATEAVAETVADIAPLDLPAAQPESIEAAPTADLTELPEIAEAPMIDLSQEEPAPVMEVPVAATPASYVPAGDAMAEEPADIPAPMMEAAQPALEESDVLDLTADVAPAMDLALDMAPADQPAEIAADLPAETEVASLADLALLPEASAPAEAPAVTPAEAPVMPSLRDALAQVTAQPSQPAAPIAPMAPTAAPTATPVLPDATSLEVAPVVPPMGDNVVQMPVFGSRRETPAAPVAPAPQAEAPVAAPVVEEVAPVVAAPAPVEAGTPAPVEPAAPALRRMRVLAAEDNKTNRLIFSKLVKACNIELRFAHDGAEAIAAYEEEVPDLIFMDISMPGVDGTEATRRIRAIEAERGLPRVRIVALTAHAMDGDAEKILKHGLDKHLTKPLKKDEIFVELDGAKPQDALPPLPEEA